MPDKSRRRRTGSSPAPTAQEDMQQTPLTEQEKRDIYDLTMRLHDLYPDRNYDRDAREGFPPNAGRGELEMLRAEVNYEETLRWEQRKREQANRRRRDSPEF